MITIKHSSWNQIQLMRIDSWPQRIFNLISQELHEHTTNALREKNLRKVILVWKTILAIETKDLAFGKWPSNWESPLIVSQVIPREAYCPTNMQGQELDKALNGKFLKKFIHLAGKKAEIKSMVVISQIPSLKSKQV